MPTSGGALCGTYRAMTFSPHDSLRAITAGLHHHSALLSLSLSLSLFLSLYFSRYTLSLASIEISSRCAIVVSKRPPWNSLWRIADSLGGTLAFTSAISEASQISSDINTFAEFHTDYTHVSNEMYAFFEEFGPVKQ